ncbi:hypothetical protein ACFE04_026709 [Oxalis oulophora]
MIVKTILMLSPDFFHIVRNGETGEYDIISHVLEVISSVMWILYSFVNPLAQMLLPFSIADATIHRAYITIFMRYATRPQRVMTVVLLLVMSLAVLLARLGAKLATLPETRDNVLGERDGGGWRGKPGVFSILCVPYCHMDRVDGVCAPGEESLCVGDKLHRNIYEWGSILAKINLSDQTKRWERKECKPNSLPVLQKMHVKLGHTNQVIFRHENDKIG